MLSYRNHTYYYGPSRGTAIYSLLTLLTTLYREADQRRRQTTLARPLPRLPRLPRTKPSRSHWISDIGFEGEDLLPLACMNILCLIGTDGWLRKFSIIHAGKNEHAAHSLSCCLGGASANHCCIQPRAYLHTLCAAAASGQVTFTAHVHGSIGTSEIVRHTRFEWEIVGHR